jgi:hypothetical protein
LTRETNLPRLEQAGRASSPESADLSRERSFEPLIFFARAAAFGPTFGFFASGPVPPDPWVEGGGGVAVPDGGGLNGLIVTLKPALPTLPEASLAVQVTAVVPTGNVESDGGVQVTAGDAGPTVSVADAVNVATAPAELVASRVMFAGTVTTGGVVSRTVTVNDLAPVFPFPSEAVQFTVVAPTGKTEPEFFEQLTGRDPVTMSVAVAAV